MNRLPQRKDKTIVLLIIHGKFDFKLLCMSKFYFVSVLFHTLSFLHLACLQGHFGPDCADRCTDTCDGCNKFNGTCDSGCNPGWQGLECQNGN